MTLRPSRYHVRARQGAQRRRQSLEPTFSQSHQSQRRLRAFHRFCHSLSTRFRCERTRSQLDIYSLPPKSFSNLKTELVKQGRKYATEALAYRDKIADLALGFIKDDSVVRVPRVSLPPLRSPRPQDPYSFLFESCHENSPPCAPEEADFCLCHRSKTPWPWVRSPSDRLASSLT